MVGRRGNGVGSLRDHAGAGNIAYDLRPRQEMCIRDRPKAILNAFTYAGFQCVTLPTMIACGTTMKNKAGCAKAMWISFVMNAVALVLSVFMLMSWQSVYTAVAGGSTRCV